MHLNQQKEALRLSGPVYLTSFSSHFSGNLFLLEVETSLDRFSEQQALRAD